MSRLLCRKPGRRPELDPGNGPVRAPPELTAQWRGEICPARPQALHPRMVGVVVAVRCCVRLLRSWCDVAYRSAVLVEGREECGDFTAGPGASRGSGCVRQLFDEHASVVHRHAVWMTGRLWPMTSCRWRRKATQLLDRIAPAAVGCPAVAVRDGQFIYTRLQGSSDELGWPATPPNDAKGLFTPALVAYEGTIRRDQWKVGGRQAGRSQEVSGCPRPANPTRPTRTR